MRNQKSTQATKNVQAIAENFTDTEGKSLKQLSDEFEEKSLDAKVQAEVDESTALLAQQLHEEFDAKAKEAAENSEVLSTGEYIPTIASTYDSDIEARIKAEVERRVHEYQHREEIAAAEKAAARSARLAEIESARIEAERIQLEKVQQESAKRESLLLANPVVDTAMYFYSPPQRTRSAKSATSSPARTSDSGESILASNGVVYSPYNQWKPRHSLKDSPEIVLAIVAEAREESAKTGKPANRAALGRKYDLHNAMVNAILTGQYYSEITGIPVPAKFAKKSAK